ncbi:chloride channel protein 2-like isoform X2 [Biomphalaria glabrata]|uniref:Chloride channel protein 2-like isoform X2 n=1 Tax=Biomphalaria glabrata TaxID=6526 RepID=A0A9W2YMU9_BIOGL|nr:chloride channel protein 2-like isoform X2 [Biomphalaria glabrata]
MTSKSSFGYEQTLLYGKYTQELSSFAKFQAAHGLQLQQAAKEEEREVKPKKLRFQCMRKYFKRVTDVIDIIFLKIGEDWIFLAILGILNAWLSFAMDTVIEKCQEAKFWLYDELQFSVGLQYVAWVSYSMLFILFAVGFTHLVSPQAIGSGIPEMKTILRGVVLKEYLTFRTLIAKVVGLCSSLGSTLPFGKEGPFVHIASIVATLLSKAITSFRGIYENESRRTEMLAAACAVGVAGTFATPIGGVLFSLEVTATYFAVRNYWRGFFSAVCGALMFKLLAYWFKSEEKFNALFKTSLRSEFPFDALELFAFAFLGVACGLGGALFILGHRSVILFTRRRKKLSRFLQKNRFIYPSVITFVIASMTFPPGLGQFFAGKLTGKMAINNLFSNITWAEGQADNINDEIILNTWNHPLTNVYVTLVLHIILNFLMTIISNTLPIPAGVFVPVFTIGAAFGRLVGESMAAWFPDGIESGGMMRKIVPGGYAVVGAASLSGSVTRTISTAVIVFEVTGQINHILPAVISVLIANAVANMFQPSFYDSIIKLKKLPYLPDIISAKSNAWLLYVEDFMVRDVKFVAFDDTYNDLQQLVLGSKHRSYPLVDSKDSMILLGSIQRFELERMLLIKLSQDQQILWSMDHRVPQTQLSLPIPTVTVTNAEGDNTGAESEPVTTKRFQVTKVTENNGVSGGAKGDQRVGQNIPMQVLAPSKDYHGTKDSQNNYHTVHAPLRSILKKSASGASLTRAHSAEDLRAEMTNFYRKLQKQRKESILEDRPFTIDKGSFQNLFKKVKMSSEPKPTKIKNLPIEDQLAWEQEQLQQPIEWEGVQIDPAPFQLVERTSLHKVHSLFSLLGLSHAFVTNTGKLVGVVGLKELRVAIQGQIELQANGKRRVSNPREEAEQAMSQEEEAAPIDDAHLEVLEEPPKAMYRLHSVKNKDAEV